MQLPFHSSQIYRRETYVPSKLKHRKCLMLKDVTLSDLKKPSKWSNAFPGCPQSVTRKRIEDNVDAAFISQMFDALRERTVATIKDMVLGNIVCRHNYGLLLGISDGDEYLSTKALGNLDS